MQPADNPTLLHNNPVPPTPQQQLIDIVRSTLGDLKVSTQPVEPKTIETAVILVAQEVERRHLPLGYVEIMEEIDRQIRALPPAKPPSEWKRLYPWKITRPGAMPGELWSAELLKYILVGPLKTIDRIVYTFEDGTTYGTTLMQGTVWTPQSLIPYIEKKKKKKVRDWRIDSTYQLYKPRVPPVPGPVMWHHTKQGPENWHTCSKEDIYSPGAIKDAMWSDRLGRYILPAFPRLVQTIRLTFTDETRTEFLHYYPGTQSIGWQRDAICRKLGKHWSRLEVVEEHYRYKIQPYERSGQSRFHLPVELAPLVDEEFEALKLQYNAKWGYAVEMPEWQDIFHYRLPPRMSAEERLLWKTKQYDLIPPARRQELFDYKVRLKIKTRRMMESPTPKVLRAIGSYSTMVDNAQDTLVTAAMLAKIGIKLAPKLSKRIVPIYGIAATGADVLNVMALFTLLPFIAKTLKRGHFTWSSLNPFSKQARLKRAAKMMHWKPTWQEIIQAAQVSDSVCGFGLCLGPLIGWIEDYVAGEVRDARGEKVVWSPGAERFRKYMRLQARFLFHLPMINIGGQTLTDQEHLAMLFNALGSIRVLAPMFQDDETMTLQDDPSDYYLKAPEPDEPILIECLQEEGVNIEDTCVWPATGKKWDSIRNLMDNSITDNIDNLRALVLRNNKTDLGILIGGLLTQIAPEALALYGGENNVEVSHAPETMVAHNLLLAQYFLPYDYTQDHVDKLNKWIRSYFANCGEIPPTPEVIKYGTEIGIQWRRELPPRPVGLAAQIWPDFLQLQEQLGGEALIS